MPEVTSGSGRLLRAHGWLPALWIRILAIISSTARKHDKKLSNKKLRPSSLGFLSVSTEETEGLVRFVGFMAVCTNVTNTYIMSDMNMETNTTHQDSTTYFSSGAALHTFTQHKHCRVKKPSQSLVSFPVS